MDSISAVLPGLASNTGIPGDMPDMPGGQFLSSALASVGIDSAILVKVGVAITIAASLFGFASNAWEGLSAVFRFFGDHVISSATLKSTDETYVYLMKYFYTHNVCIDSRLFGVTSRKNTSNPNYQIYTSWYDRSMSNNDDIVDMDGTERNEDNLGPTLKYTPAPGFYYFFFQGTLIILRRVLGEDYYGFETPEETVTLYTIGRNPKMLRTLLEKARAEYLVEEKTNKLLIHTTQATYPPTWSVGMPKLARELDTVVMKKEDKILLLKDMKEYIQPRTMRWYRKRGIPWRRGYLFHGPPGTGKTSLTMALAQELNLKLYILSLGTSTLADDGLHQLFGTLPKRCIVLIEDIDSAGVNRDNIYAAGGLMMSRETNEDDSDIEEDEDSKNAAAKSKIASNGQKKKKVTTTNAALTLSGLLNAIDGIASNEGRILIMTTNHRDALDEAMLRPGRVDHEVEFGRADKEILTHIFRNIYIDDEDDEDDDVSEYADSVDSLAEEKREAKIARIELMAEEFAEKIPLEKFTPAEIQGFLLRYKFDAQEALNKIEGWVTEKLEEIDDFKELEKRAERKEQRAREKKIKELRKKRRDEAREEKRELEELEKEEEERKEKEEKKKKEAEDKANGIVRKDEDKDDDDKKKKKKSKKDKKKKKEESESEESDESD